MAPINGNPPGSKWIVLMVVFTSLLSPAPLLAQKTNSPKDPIQSRSPEGIESRAVLLRQFSAALENMVRQVSPAVVQIQASGLAPAENENGVAFIARHRAIGSGVIVDPDGYIVTNAHLVEGAQRIRVVLPTPTVASPLEIPPLAKQQIFDARLMGMDAETDLAVLKVEGDNLPTVTLDRNRPVQPGELVVAIGSPEGLQSSITMGVVSSVWRQPQPDLPMVYIQTDAPINPGNSGGPLVDVDGRVVGINTFILTKGGGSEGLGFAIPASVVALVYEDLRRYGRVHRTELQVHAQTVTPTLAAGLGLGQSWGVIISDVTAGGRGDSAGLKVGDIVMSVDRIPVLSLPGLMASLSMHPAEQALRLQILRDSRTIALNVPPMGHHDMMERLADFIDPRNRIELLGIFVVDSNDRMREVTSDSNMPDGVIVVGQSPDATSLRGDVRTGDIIRAVNRTPVESVEQFKSVIHAMKLGDPLVLQIERQRVLQYVSFEPE